MPILQTLTSPIRRLFARPPRAELTRTVTPMELELAYRQRREVVADAQKIAPRYLLPPPEAAAGERDFKVVTQGSWMDAALSSAGWRLSPEKLFQIYTQAELGRPSEQCSAFESLQENDGHLQGLITTRKADILGRDLWIIPGDDRPGSITAAKALAESIVDSNLEELVEHMMEAPGFGYSYAETQWALDGTWAVPRWFALTPHRRFWFNDGNVAHLDMGGTGRPDVALDRDPRRWVLAEMYHRRTPRAGFMRCCGWWAVFKRTSVRDLMAFAEKFGIPMVLGMYSDDSGPKSRKVLEEIIRRIGIDGNAVMSDQMQVKVMDQPMRQGDGAGLHGAVMAAANAEMSKAVNGATLTSDSGAGASSYALGKVHEGRAGKISVADARRIGRWFKRSVGRPFVELNGMTDAAAPYLHVALLPDNPLQDAQVLSTLSGIGLPLSMSQVQRRYGLRPPINDGDKLERPVDANPGPGAKPPSE